MTEGEPQKLNLAFIDGQNLHFGTTKCYDCAKRQKIKIPAMKLSDCSCDKAWEIDLSRFREYLTKKYNVGNAYYFLGCLRERHQELYDEIQEAGFILKFREHNSAMAGKKKGNVDTDIVFDIMKKIHKEDNFDKIVIISGDGDYKKLVDFLIEEKRFEKILSPNDKFASSLYKEITSTYYDNLDSKEIREKIEKKERATLGS